MASSPLPIMAVVVPTLVFIAVLGGAETFKESFPQLFNPEPGECDGALDALICGVKYVINFFLVIFGVVAYILKLISFDVPGAPIYVRVIVGSIIGGAILWSVAGLMRGN